MIIRSKIWTPQCLRNNNMLPNFLIAGVSRCGTTSIYNYLKQHPEISFPELKEPRYFSSYKLRLPQSGPGDFSVDKKLITSFDSYNSLYKSLNNKFVGDASSEYVYNYNSSIPEIKKRLGDIPIIIILRNPIHRSYSAYNNLVRDNRETKSFEEALELESQRKIEGYDEMWHYISVSKYLEPIKAFTSEFSRVKIIIFENFENNESQTLREIIEFLGVYESDFEFDTSKIYSKAGKLKFRFISVVFGRGNLISNTLREVVFSLIGRDRIELLVKKLLKGKEVINPKVVKKLNSVFEEDIEGLEKLLKLDLSLWK